jgi:hypothetical protein
MANECCPKAFEAPANRSGNQTVTTGSGARKAGEEFDMLATFAEDEGSSRCGCCEYRQYVRGNFTYNGQPLVHHLPSGPLDPTTFLEDGILGALYGPHFGHRNEAGAWDDRYQPDRDDGCEYRGHDFPGIAGNSGSTFEIDLEFRGEIIDVCSGGAVLRSAIWKVRYRGRL